MLKRTGNSIPVETSKFVRGTAFQAVETLTKEWPGGKASISRAEYPRITLRSSWPSHTSHFKTDTLGAALPNAWNWRVSAKAGGPVTSWDSKFGLQLLSQCGNKSNCPSIPNPEIHLVCCWTVNNHDINKPAAAADRCLKEHLVSCPAQSKCWATGFYLVSCNFHMYKKLRFFFFCLPSYISGVHHFGWDFCACGGFFFFKSKLWGSHIPSLWMVHAGCVFLTGIHPSRTWMSGPFDSVRRNACVRRPRFILSSKKVLGGMESEPMLTPREKTLYRTLRGGSNPRHCTTQDSELNTLPTELFRPRNVESDVNIVKCIMTAWAALPTCT